jgi:hypothetical protein
MLAGAVRVSLSAQEFIVTRQGSTERRDMTTVFRMSSFIDVLLGLRLNASNRSESRNATRRMS